uniref:Uncharacterized protein n=1 Tax=Siphoviridae sp. ctNEy24 TaxID=2825466 RepID=A0A8S5U0J3_9CAUD|nr:MAG TPA: hypothetical protein [Siphoviridae sp. ctNEy24]
MMLLLTLSANSILRTKAKSSLSFLTSGRRLSARIMIMFPLAKARLCITDRLALLPVSLLLLPRL